MKINVLIAGRNVLLKFECDTPEEAQKLGTEIAEQMKRGDLHMTMVDPECITPSKTEH